MLSAMRVGRGNRSIPPTSRGRTRRQGERFLELLAAVCPQVLEKDEEHTVVDIVVELDSALLSRKRSGPVAGLGGVRVPCAVARSGHAERVRRKADGWLGVCRIRGLGRGVERSHLGVGPAWPCREAREDAVEDPVMTVPSFIPVPHWGHLGASTSNISRVPLKESKF